MKRNYNNVFQAVKKFPETGILIPLILIMLITQLFNPNFLTLTNITALLKTIPFIALATLGASFPLINGNIDISVGRIAGLSGMVFGALLTASNWPVAAAVAGGISVGLVVGIMNGIFVVYCKMAPFIATMGTLYICGGLRYLVRNGSIMSMPDYIKEFAIQAPLRVSWAFWFVVICYLFTMFVQQKTVFGRMMYAVGNNKEVARLQGVNINFIQIAAYMISGVFSAIAGILATMDVGTATPSTGTAWEFKALAACVIGGTSLNGGTGRAFGVSIGVFIVFVLTNIINMIGLSNYWSDVFTGVILAVAVGIDTLKQRRKTKA